MVFDCSFVCSFPKALADAEDEQDVLAARQVAAEQVAELAEFSETATDEQQVE